MATMRHLLGSLLAGVIGGTAVAQGPAGVPVYPPSSGVSRPGIVPPPGSSQAVYGGVTAMSSQSAGGPAPSPDGKPAPTTPGTPPSPLDIEATPAAPPTLGPTGLLTVVPSGLSSNLPRGSVESPWVGSRRCGSNCNGPVGANGPLGYELYVRTGPNLVVGGEDLGLSVRTGWSTGGGGRALLFNPAGDRAWVLDLGINYIYNQGKDQRVLGVFTPGALDPNTNLPTDPDEVNSYFIRGLHRTNFNFAIGRDWFLRGAGNLGMEPGPNWRVGADVGGQWGTSHVDLIPVGDPTNYLRRTSVTHGFFIGSHATWEKPLGAYILYGGLRAQWGYTWANLIPPLGSDISDVSLLMTVGLRY